jgi:hypothetical protein
MFFFFFGIVIGVVFGVGVGVRFHLQDFLHTLATDSSLRTPPLPISWHGVASSSLARRPARSLVPVWALLLL